MYEPIRAKSVHSTARADVPHRSREEELDIQLAGHLAALLTATDELRTLDPGAALDDAAEQLTAQVLRLLGRPPMRLPEASAACRRSDGASAEPPTAISGGGGGPRIAALHRRAHALAGRALVVAESRVDTAVAILAAERMDAHAAAASRELTNTTST